jgi:hypothetical protein
VAVGYDENVRTGDRVDIAKCSHLLIAVDNDGRGFTS